LGPDKVGYGRIIESLETNSWPDSKFKNAVMQKQRVNENDNRNDNNNNKKEEITTTSTSSTTTTTTTISTKDNNKQTNGKSTNEKNNNSKAIDKTGLPSGTSLLPKPNRKDYMTIKGKNEEGDDDFDQREEEDEVEPELRNYEFALSQIVNFRQNTKHLSQDERMDLAEKLLSDFIGMGGLGVDEDE